MYTVKGMGTVADVLRSNGSLVAAAQSFARDNHRLHGVNGESYLAIAILDGYVVLLSGTSDEELIEALAMHDAPAVEVLKLTNLH